MTGRAALSPGLCSVTFRQLDPGPIIELASACGIAGIEWGTDKHVPAGDVAHARAVAAACRARGIAVASIGSYVEAGADAGQTFPEILEIAVAMEAPNIRVWAGQRGIGAAQANAEARRRAAAALSRMCRDAGARRIAVGLEFHPDTLTDEIGSTLDLINRVGAPNLFSYWQPWPGITPATALAQMAALKGHISHLHVFSWTAAKDRLALAAGEDFWLPVLRQAVADGGGGPHPRYAILEFVAGDRPEAFREDARTLVRWLDQVNFGAEAR